MSDRSHSYQFTRRDMIRLLTGPVLLLCAFALLMHLGALLSFLPRPRPALDADRTILFHQAEASWTKHPAEVVLIGDSSCLMDVSALQLGELAAKPHSALNLGTLSYLDLGAFGEILKHYLTANPNRVKTVVLLMHPEALRRPSPAEYDLQALENFYAGTDFCGPALPRLMCGLGVEVYRGRVLSRIVPQPLPGGFGRYYGFNQDLWKYLSAHDGSALDPGRFDPARAKGNAEYRLAKSLRETSELFRSLVPPGIRLAAGITPVPESFVANSYRETQRRLLDDWNHALRADTLLTELPATLPDAFFASATHLNEEGVKSYTDLLHHCLAARPGSLQAP